MFVRPLQNHQFKSHMHINFSFCMAPTHVSGVAEPKNRSGRTEMMDYDKGRIDTYHDIELNLTEISKKVDWPTPTLRSYLQKRRTCGYQNLPHSGRPPKMDCSFCILKCYVQRNRRQNYTTVQANTLFNISIQTIQRKLCKELNTHK